MREDVTFYGVWSSRDESERER